MTNYPLWDGIIRSAQPATSDKEVGPIVRGLAILANELEALKSKAALLLFERVETEEALGASLDRETALWTENSRLTGAYEGLKAVTATAIRDLTELETALDLSADSGYQLAVENERLAARYEALREYVAGRLDVGVAHIEKTVDWYIGRDRVVESLLREYRLREQVLPFNPDALPVD